MALKSTIHKAQLQIADMSRHYYQDHDLTVARHPSETDMRMMLRVLMFAMYADDRLTFSKGLCQDDEPELWHKNDIDEVELWLDLGLPDPKRIKKACRQAKQVVLLTYGTNARQWWQKHQSQCDFNNLSVLNISAEQSDALALFASRNMQLSFTLEQGSIFLTDTQKDLSIDIEQWR